MADYDPEFNGLHGLAVGHTITGRDHPETSFAAARRAIGRSGTNRRRVLEALVAADRTDEELQAALGLPPNSQRPRRVELVDAGLVAATEARRPTATGAASIVWAATELGRDALVAAQRQERTQ